LIHCSERVKKTWRSLAGTKKADQLRLSGLADICFSAPKSEGPSPLVHLAVGPWSPTLPLVLSALSSLFCLPLLHRFLPTLPLAEWESHLPAESRAAVLSIKTAPEIISSFEFRAPRAAGKHVESGLLYLNGGRTWEQSFGHPFETRELLDTLKGSGPLALIKLTMEIGAEMFLRGGVCASLREARYMIREALLSGRAAAAFSDFMAAHGIDSFDGLMDEFSLHQNEVLCSPQEGYLRCIDTAGIRRMIRRAEGRGQRLGLQLLKKEGDYVEKGTPLAEILSAWPEGQGVQPDDFSEFLTIGSDPLPYFPLVLERVEGRSAS
jgi:hypothetical protein